VDLRSDLLTEDSMNDRSSFRSGAETERGAAAKSGGAGVPPAVFLPLGSGLTIRRRRLPHWEVQEATYFVTFRLADSLPKKVLQEVDSKRKDILATERQMSRKLTATEHKKLRQLQSRRLERTLDAGAGECLLRNPVVAKVVATALKQFDGSRYRLFAWCVMPNHVHVLFQTIGKASLADILHSWKSYSAKAANQVLGRSGEFWQREYHDHLIRDLIEFDRAVRYVSKNPSQAGLKNWPWVWRWE
jgi:REP element-mobilizing transposase RayT